MSIKAIITDKGTGISADVVKNDACDCKALAVATVPYVEYDNVLKFFTNSDYGINMNVNVTVTGTPEIVHDGIDLTKWTATDIVGGGKTTFDNDEHTHEAIITVLTYGDLTGKVITIIVSGTTTTITEGGDYTAETSNDVTATNIASFMNGIGVTGISATASGAVVTVTADVGYDITSLAEDADVGDLTATAQSVKVDNSPVGDVYQFDKGSDLDCTGYKTLTMWVYADKDWKAGDVVSLYGWDTGTGLQVGTTIDLKNYFSYLDQDQWHKIVIPLTDMGDVAESTTLDSLRIKQSTAEGKAPKYYLDEIQFEEAGEPVEFTVAPDKGTWLHIQSMQITIATSVLKITLADVSMPMIPYNNFFGVSKLATGITYRRFEDGVVKNTTQISQFLDLMSFSNAKVTGFGTDGTNTWISINITFTEPIVLKAEDESELQLVINDDLSGLLELKVSVGAKVETR